MCTPRANNSLYTAALPPVPPDPLITRRAFFNGGPLSRASGQFINPNLARENNEATCKGDPYVPPLPFIETEFTAGGQNFYLATGEESSTPLGAYEITLTKFTVDGVITPFFTFISPINVVPPYGVAFGVSYLDETNTYQTGYAIRTEL